MCVLRGLLLGLLSLSLLGCAADDPFAVTVQTLPPTTTAADGSEPAEPTVFPPVAEGVSRPKNIVDLRGQSEVVVEIRDNVFETRFFRVDPGTLIRFVNKGANPHNVTPSAAGAFDVIDEQSLFDGPQVLALTIEGDYPFYCSIHGTPKFGQTGYIIVGDG